MANENKRNQQRHRQSNDIKDRCQYQNVELVFFGSGSDGEDLRAQLGDADVRPSLHWRPLPTEGETVNCHVQLNRQGDHGVAYPADFGLRPRQLVCRLTFRTDRQGRPVSRFEGRIVLGERARVPIGVPVTCEMEEVGTCCFVTRFKPAPAETATPAKEVPRPAVEKKPAKQCAATIGEMLAAKQATEGSPDIAASIAPLAKKANAAVEQAAEALKSTQEYLGQAPTNLPPNMVSYYRRQLAAAEKQGNEAKAVEIRKILGLAK